MANNNNSVSIKPYHLLNSRVHKDFKTNWGSLRLFTGLNNLSNTTYYDNIRINTFGGRYYEPAPTRNIYVGLEIGV